MRGDDQTWQQVEAYIATDHTEVEFSHGICPPSFEEAMRGIPQKG